jgi:hypothetical protein
MRPGTALPLDVTFNLQYRSIAKSCGLSDKEGELEFEKFCAWYQARGSERPHWPTTWRSWIARIGRYKPRQSTGRLHGPASSQDSRMEPGATAAGSAPSRLKSAKPTSLPIDLTVGEFMEAIEGCGLPDAKVDDLFMSFCRCYQDRPDFKSRDWIAKAREWASRKVGWMAEDAEKKKRPPPGFYEKLQAQLDRDEDTSRASGRPR